jgi:hypothetical protein
MNHIHKPRGPSIDTAEHAVVFICPFLDADITCTGQGLSRLESMVSHSAGGLHHGSVDPSSIGSDAAGG